MVGRVIQDKYRITHLLARGGMGKVYKALQAPLDRVCAVKVLTPPEHEAADGQFHKRFFLEASIGARLTHPNTVTIFDYGCTEDGVYFIAMEYLEGKTLSRVLREQGAFDEERATHVARQVCRSLREAHTLGVVHRDLKPANVYLIEHGDETDVVKVLDFGLVKNVENTGGEDLTQTGLFMGSPKYMSPEQVKGESVDARTDIYSLGVMLYEMVTGHVPYEKPKQLDILLAHVNEPLPPLRDKKPDLQISEALEAVILRCLAKNPAERFASMEEVLATLKLTGGGQLSATRTGVVDLHSSGTFTPQPLSASGEIPAANPMSIAPSAEKPKKRLALVASVLALAAVGVVAVVARKSHPSDVASAATQVQPPKPAVTAPAPTTAVVPPPAAAPAKKEESPKVEIDSDPVGARVRDEQHAILCDKTPCSVQLDTGAMTIVVEHDGYSDQKVKIAPGDPRHTVKLSKAAVWHPSPSKPAAAAPTGNGGFKGDPYGAGPY